MLIYGATPAATSLVEQALQSSPGLYGQGPEEELAPREQRVRAGLKLLTDHGFRLPHLHAPHPRIALADGGFGYEKATIPAGLRFSGLGEKEPQHYRPDDPSDYQHFLVARLEADALGYQFYRAQAPFGEARFIVDGTIDEPSLADRWFKKMAGAVSLYDPYSGDGSRARPYVGERLTIRRYLDFNPEFARFSGFTHGWRSKPTFQWTLWDMLQAHSECSDYGFVIEVNGWRLDSDFGIQPLLSDKNTFIVSFTNARGQRGFLTWEEALRQVAPLETFPSYDPGHRAGREAGNQNYLLDPDDWIMTNPILLMKWHGMGGSVSIPRRLF